MKILFAIIALCFITQKSLGQGQIYRIKGTNTYVAAVLTEKFNYSFATQKLNNWCWAACVQMVLNYQKIDVDQDQIVQRVFGSLLDRPADCSTMTRAANNWRYNNTIKAFSSGISAEDMIDDLAKKYPLIIGLNIPNQKNGHAYVLTAIYFELDYNGDPIPTLVSLRDPWPASPPILQLKWENFSKRINCVVHVTY
jgi:hypothetical protein